MENWGLITYRETALLYKDGVSSANNKQRIATVVSHELAHQWFGKHIYAAPFLRNKKIHKKPFSTQMM